MDRADAVVPTAIVVAVAVREALHGALATRRSGMALDLQFYQSLRDEADHLARQASIGTLLQ